MDLSVPVLAEPPPVCTSASAVSESGPRNEARENGEARESTETDKPATSQRALERGSGLDSRGGQVYLPDVHVLTIDDLTYAHVALTAIGVLRGRRADYLPLNKWDETP
jgi:hypothetical protein